jgi:hypothetical protein
MELGIGDIHEKIENEFNFGSHNYLIMIHFVILSVTRNLYHQMIGSQHVFI